jgi:hypothetical protein
MKRSATVLSRGSEYDAFLFAPIGEERNGMLLSVLSALARLDLDPWREAAELAGMPRQIAKQRLTSLIQSLPVGPQTRPKPEAISTRLIALLPNGAGPSVASSGPFPVADPILNSKTLMYALLINLLFLAGMTGAQWAESSPPPSSATIESSQASAAGLIPPASSSPYSSR